MTVDSLIDLKYKNLKSIIDYIRFRDSSTKREVARELNLSFATVSNMVNGFISQGLVIETEADTVKYVGRYPKYISLAPMRYGIVTVDLHASGEMLFSLVDLKCTIRARERFETQPYENIAGYIAQIRNGYLTFLKNAGYEEENVLGVGAVISGTYDAKSDRMVGTARQAFLNQPFRRLISEAVGKPVCVENDANLAAYYRAFALGCANLIYVYMGDGIGMGVVSGNDIMLGARGYSAEIAHVPMGTLARVCPSCGNHNCLQTDLSRNGFLSKARGELIDWDAPLDTAWGAYVAALEQGEARAVAAARENAALLARTLSIAQAVTRPQIIMFGGLPRVLYEIIVPFLEAEINSRVPLEPAVDFAFDEDSLVTFAKGAAEMVYARWHPDLTTSAES